MSSAFLQTFTAALRASFPWTQKRYSLPQLPGASAALAGLALARLRPAAPVVVVTPGNPELEMLYADTQALAEPQDTPLFFPPLEGESPESDLDLQGFRIDVLRALAGSQTLHHAPVILASVAALQQKSPDPQALERATRRLKIHDTVDFNALLENLVEGGYTRSHETAEKGHFSVHGGVVDIWPVTRALPVRAEFFGDTLESLRRFDPSTQVSVEKILEEEITPCVSPANLRSQTSLLQRLPPGSTLLWLDHDRLAQHARQREKEFPHVIPFDKLCDVADAIPSVLQIFSGDPAPRDTPAIPLRVAPFAGLADMQDDLRHPDALATARQRLLRSLTTRAQAGEAIHICVDTAGTCDLITREIGPDIPLVVAKLALSGGFVLGDLTVVAQPDLYAIRKHLVRRSTPDAVAHRGAALEAIADLELGDRVVHLDYGIGTYCGATEIEIDGRRVEVFTLEYADNTRIHVPVSHTHLISRYVGVKGVRVASHRIGGKRWTREKHDAERAILDLAASLLETQARRQTLPGHAFQVDLPWMNAFEASFPYQETPDQTRVIRDVKADLAAARPMDRLVCGDAGYGKTEIAMRAAFIAVMNGKQVAFLAPTTILVEQHYETLRERMADYPFRIEVLSRFRTPAWRKNVIDQLTAGAIDIVIGTHALLQPGITFKDLGLLIIDEEQRFGVAHKEALKHLRATVDILTLSATPIPRTLYMSMTGARDMSLLQTPPRERLPVETRVVRDADETLRTAIRQELARDGQIYFLFNRVATIHLMYQRLRRLVPEATIAVAHGQMPPAELAPVMRAFENGQTQLLLCTTLVENGLDIPRANTIIVHRADRFGIADLYQLRGRVGRSSHKGFAWFLLPDHGHIDEDARQRIAALQKHTGLGAGYNLALRDLELRGGGSLLGSRQSGHIAAVGFTLYCQLLKRTVAQLKGEKPPTLVDVTLTLDFLNLSPDDPSAAALPYTYIEDESHRVALYRRLAEASHLRDISALRDEIRDRFGPPPPPVLRLLRMNEIRVLAAQRGLCRVESRDNKLHLFRDASRDPLLINNRLPSLKPGPPNQQLDALFALIKKFPMTM